MAPAQSAVMFTGEARGTVASRVASSLSHRRVPIELALELLEAWNHEHCSPPLPDEDLSKLVSDIWLSGLRRRDVGSLKHVSALVDEEPPVAEARRRQTARGEPTPTSREAGVALLRRAGEVLGEAATIPELSVLVAAFKNGLALPGGPFLATQITFERRSPRQPDEAPVVRVPRETGGRPVKAETLIPAALADIEAATGGGVKS